MTVNHIFPLRIIYSAFRFLQSKIKLTFIEHPLCSSHCSKHVLWIHSLNPSNSPTTSPFYRWENWSSRTWNDLPKVPGLPRGRTTIWTQIESNAVDGLVGSSHPCSLSQVAFSRGRGLQPHHPIAPREPSSQILLPREPFCDWGGWWRHTDTPKVWL